MFTKKMQVLFWPNNLDINSKTWEEWLGKSWAGGATIARSADMALWVYHLSLHSS